ncbi:MAG: hypothetical protein ABI721_01280 [Candidatus Dojkabacteria bacterium]
MTKKKTTNNFIRNAVTGAALVGAGALMAAAALSDDDTKKKLSEGAKKAGDRITELVEELKVKGGSAYKEALEQFEILRVKVEKMVEEGKKSEEYKKVLEGISDVTAKLNEAKDTSGDELQTLLKEVKSSVDELKEEYDKYEESFYN